VSAALIAADGQSAGTPFEILGPLTGNAGMFDGTWVGDAFNVAVSAFVAPTYFHALRIVRIDVNGTLTTRDLLMDEFEEAPRLARGAADTRITYIARGSFDLDVEWRRFGPAGEPLAEALLAQSIHGYTQSPAVALGDDTLVLVADDDQTSSLAITRVDRASRVITPQYDIARAPTFTIFSPDMVRRGPDAIVSWLALVGVDWRVGLARITP
jgi:hypothetical protein